MRQKNGPAWLAQACATGAATILLSACATPGGQSVYEQAAGAKDDPRAIERLVSQAEDLTVVDCLLPGKMRRMGRTITWVTRPRPVKQTATDCEILGGQYILFDRANPQTALAVWMSAAEAGDSTAQTYVGEIHERGLGRARDYNTAARWYRKAADQGNPRAQLLLGTLYEQGLGVERNPVQALDLYRKAAGLSKDRVVYLSQALATARATQARGAGKSVDRAKANAQVQDIRSARKSSDRQVRSTDAQIVRTKQEAKAATRQGRTTRTLDQQSSLALNTKQRLIDQTIALESVSTRRDGLRAIENLGDAVVAQR